MRAFAEGVDVLTVEIEHVDAEAVQQVGAKTMSCEHHAIGYSQN